MNANPTNWQRSHRSPQISQQAQAKDRHSQEQHPRIAQKRKTSSTSAARLPLWRSHFIGYPVSILLVGMALFLSYLLKSFASASYFVGQPFVFATAAIALLWGVGPVLFAIVLEYFAVDIFLISPFRVFDIGGQGDVVTFGPFILAQLLIAFLTIKGESHRRHLLQAKKDVEAESREIERANRFKSLFLSIASHELKTPITAIRAQAQLALRRSARSQQTMFERPSLSIHLEKIEAETHRLHTLVNDLLDLGSIDSGKMPLQFAQCDLGKLCQKVVEDQQALSGRHINLETPPNPIVLQADGGRLTQVIINLVANAVKYSPENMPIQVHTGQNQTYAIVQVHNDGSVIPQEYQEHIFEPFYRLPSNQQGSGLGLAISKEIVERHRGHIWVESSEEKGTTFFVELPYKET
ncbi:MAG TPA: HAMP domain-containing sensor histidine kinase [Ktedonobacteraceae bacterium]|jgi:signal transduction histidine kinase